MIVVAAEVLCVLLMGWDRHAFQASAPWFVAAIFVALVGDLLFPIFPKKGM
jgi:hypothetical protein